MHKNFDASTYSFHKSWQSLYQTLPFSDLWCLDIDTWHIFFQNFIGKAKTNMQHVCVYYIHCYEISWFQISCTYFSFIALYYAMIASAHPTMNPPLQQVNVH